MAAARACPLFFIGFYFYSICDNLAFNLSDAYELDWQLCCFITNFLILSSGSCLTNFAGICAGGVLVAEKAYHLRHTQPVDYFIIEHCELVMVLALVLLLLALWCSFALILRRLRDTRPGLWALPLCLPGLWLLGIELLPLEGMLQSYLWYALLAHVVFLLPSRKGASSAG